VSKDLNPQSAAEGEAGIPEFSACTERFLSFALLEAVVETRRAGELFENAAPSIPMVLATVRSEGMRTEMVILVTSPHRLT